MILGWSSDLVLCTDGPAEFADVQHAELARHGVPVRELSISRRLGATGVLEQIVFADGSSLFRRAMLLELTQHLRSDRATRLGCLHAQFGLILTDEWGETSIAGVYAAGDAVSPIQHLSRAAASGTTAAIGMNRSLLAETLPLDRSPSPGRPA